MPPSAPTLTPAEYYAKHYPYEQLVKLLTRNGDDLANCEFAIEGKTSAGDKLYKRYVSVRSPSELRNAVSRFTGVTAFHFGAFYSNGSAKGAVKSGESVPVRRVLSFDIDLTDLEFLSLKDAEGNVSAEKCDAAYPVSAAAAYIVRTVMRKAFGFSEILVVYSGRRGVHVHVFDDKAMGLNDEARSAILDYVNCGMAKTELHAPAGVRLIMDLHGLRGLVYNTFHTYIVGRLDVFENASARLALLDRLNLASYEEYETFAPTLAPLATDVLRCETGAEAWKHVEERIRSTNVEWMRERLDCVVLAYVWPRLDEAVTRSLGHLTKVPFSCHAATGRVAVAMEAKQKSIYKFLPARQAPSLKQWQQPVMDAAVAHFRREPTAAEKKRKEREERENAETGQLIDYILATVWSADEARRRDTWVTMPLPPESEAPKVTDQARRIAWAKHGVPYAAVPARRMRFDVYGNKL